MAGLQLSTVGRLSELIPPRDYSNLNQQDCQLRVWLPDPAKQALEELCEINEMSMTAYLTEYFASYLFGHHEVMRMRANRSGLYEPESESRYCAIDPDGPEPEPEVAPNLGKNIFALKIWVPEKIKNGLRFQADRAGITLGEFSRSLICSHLFGCEFASAPFKGTTSLVDSIAREWEGPCDD
jgi:hypothetical protein